jgi:hypothetical protein
MYDIYVFFDAVHLGVGMCLHICVLVRVCLCVPVCVTGFLVEAMFTHVCPYTIHSTHMTLYGSHITLHIPNHLNLGATYLMCVYICMFLCLCVQVWVCICSHGSHSHQVRIYLYHITYHLISLWWSHIYYLIAYTLEVVDVCVWVSFPNPMVMLVCPCVFVCVLPDWSRFSLHHHFVHIDCLWYVMTNDVLFYQICTYTWRTTHTQP